jgi:hypothetical protein
MSEDTQLHTIEWKVLDNIDLEVLLKYNFCKLYDQYTGELIKYRKIYEINEHNIIYIDIDINTRILKFKESKYCDYELFKDGFIYNFVLNICYPLIKDNIIEQVINKEGW